MEKEQVNEKLNEFFEYTVKFAEKYPEIASNFTTLMGSVIQDGKLKSKEKELIAVGIAVGLRCLPCIHAHTKSAINMGATEEEIEGDVGSESNLEKGGRSALDSCITFC